MFSDITESLLFGVLLALVGLSSLILRHVAHVQEHLNLFAFEIADFVDGASHDFELLGEVALDLVEQLVLEDDCVLLVTDEAAQSLDLAVLFVGACAGVGGALLRSLDVACGFGILALALSLL